MMGASLGICALFLTPLAAVDLPSKVPSGGAIASVAVLGLVCTALAFLVFTVLIREAGTSRATVITYINPVVAVALGVALLNESPGAGAVAGLLLILAGSWLSTGGKLPPMLMKRVASRSADPTCEAPAAAWGRGRQASRDLSQQTA
jgi:drug/metabolite transporter (DMT)-like permease